MEAEFEAIREAVRAADLTDETRHTVGWCLEKLPALCREFSRTNESRFGDEIRRLTQAVLKSLTEAGVASAVTGQLQALHARLGLQGLEPKPTKPLRRKKAS
jgi:uncharacterized NAD(P)/FAD-binding protein YdhS